MAQLPFILLMAVVDGKVTQQEIDQIVSALTQIVKDVLSEV